MRADTYIVLIISTFDSFRQPTSTRTSIAFAVGCSCCRYRLDYDTFALSTI